MPFKYPRRSIVRKHGPTGYKNYPAYRPWLRDEFDFRCVYCLKRETWGTVVGEFDLDHFEPQAVKPGLREDYDNLVYSCHTCNLLKSDLRLPDPATALNSESIRVEDDGTLIALNDEAKRVIDVLQLNGENYVGWRLLWLRIVELARQEDPDLLTRILGFPANLPDLKRLQPPGGNTRPDGIAASSYERSRRGELPETY